MECRFGNALTKSTWSTLMHLSELMWWDIHVNPALIISSLSHLFVRNFARSLVDRSAAQLNPGTRPSQGISSQLLRHSPASTLVDSLGVCFIVVCCQSDEFIQAFSFNEYKSRLESKCSIQSGNCTGWSLGRQIDWAPNSHMELKHWQREGRSFNDASKVG